MGSQTSDVDTVMSPSTPLCPWQPHFGGFLEAARTFLLDASASLEVRLHEAVDENNPDWLSLAVVRGGLMKTADDVQAALVLDRAGLVGPAYATARTLFESLVDMVYLAPGDPELRRARASCHLLWGLVEDQRIRQLGEITNAWKAEGVRHPDMQALSNQLLSEAVDAVRTQVAEPPESLSHLTTDDLVAHLGSWQAIISKRAGKSGIPHEIMQLVRPSMPRRLKAIREENPGSPGVSHNLEFSYYVVYPQASAFTHSSGGLFHAQSSPVITGLRREPVTFTTLVVRDIVWIANALYVLELDGSVKGVLDRAERVFAAVKEM